MAMIIGARTGTYNYNNVADESPAPGIQQRLTLTKSVNGFALSISLDEARCMCPFAWLWNSIGFIKSVNHGDGVQGGDNFMLDPTDQSSWNQDAPTPGGSASDGTNFRACVANSRVRWMTTTGGRHIANPGQWAKPGQTITPPHNSRSQSKTAECLRDTTMQIGAFGNDNIFLWDSTLIVPTLARYQASRVLKMCSLTVYSDDVVFDGQEYFDPATGVFSTYPGYPANSSSLGVASTHSDGSKAIAAFTTQADTTFYSGYHVTGIYDSFVIQQIDFGSGNGTPAGRYRQRGAVVWGTRAQFQTAIQVANTNLPLI